MKSGFADGYILPTPLIDGLLKTNYEQETYRPLNYQ